MELRLPIIKKHTIQNKQPGAIHKEPIIIDNVEEEPSLVMQKLVREEADLLEEKEKLHTLLTSLRKKLKLEVQRNIRRKKRSIKKLRAEIKDLKVCCEELSKTLKFTANAISIKKRSKEEFEVFLKDMLNFDYPKIKYQNPDAWRQVPTKKDE
jgi:predicted RNase H-like nuclease (RuvC/YqgF family)